ncbi:hypothetical protein SAMD00019534_012550 [Acytostelium subglobosum LB1]|uniref:hypothetical protein n=1 Tax=Acytostelium subglobosum LB1 TaxID=1410327 RepID=UPI000644D47F|nr:hypothetical protein SAMD00019534_012550 [Acytostelium subglobosum LB1]GAM18080.1 hypothetical protein SAMD00019534_012550 [Acytostelium subglobosum LB1]|eukprot:XP_012758676.1 hypothetical protein SAMD00019534_012550 [Acytostelium subglobosum LB1]
MGARIFLTLFNSAGDSVAELEEALARVAGGAAALGAVYGEEGEVDNDLPSGVTFLMTTGVDGVAAGSVLVGECERSLEEEATEASALSVLGGELTGLSAAGLLGVVLEGVALADTD